MRQLRHTALRGRRALAASVVLTAVAGAVPLFGPAGSAVAADDVLPTFSSAETAYRSGLAVRDVKTMSVAVASDRTTVVVFRARPASGTDRTNTYYAVTRAGGSSVWTAPVALGSTPREAEDRELITLTTAGPSVVALWREYPGDIGSANGTPGRLVSASFTSGRWSATTEVLPLSAGLRPREVKLAAGPGGTATAVWVGWVGWTPRASAPAVVEVQTATRASDGTWSAPVRVGTPGSGQEAPQYTDLAVDAAGNATLLYQQGDRLLTAGRPAGAAQWNAPEPLDTGAAPSPDWSGPFAPALAAGGTGTGTLAVTWQRSLHDGERTRSASYVTIRKSGDATWSTPAPVTEPGKDVASLRPVVESDADVTLVWDGDDAINTREWEADTRTWGDTYYRIRGGFNPRVAATKSGRLRIVANLMETRNGKSFRTQVELSRSADGIWWDNELVGGSSDTGYGALTVNERGEGTYAWSGPQDTVKSARTAPAPGPLKIVSKSVPPTAKVPKSTADAAWAPSWTLDRAVSTWDLTVTDPRTGRTVWTAPQGEVFEEEKDLLAPRWNGRLANGSLVPDGPLSWTLKATAEGVRGERVLATGTVTVTAGGRTLRDFGSGAGAPDNIGDVFSVTSTGGIRIAYGHPATGNFSGSKTGTGWKAGTLPVPMGDMDGDRCNDVLVRMTDGQLRRYSPGCKAAALTPNTPYKVVGKGWNAYDIITSPGDLDNDGLPDLVARDPKTGILYRYDTDPATGLPGARIVLRNGVNIFKKIVGVGDINGDGVGDLVAHGSKNGLFRMEGDGKGDFLYTKRIAKDWGASYDTLVGIGDLNGDGHNDLLARDTSGKIWRLAGTGQGTFGPRFQLGTGWQVYKTVR
ncbi:VCBS repeat-containing protein [Streptomyces sp. NPDC097619]|uniref:FG-GAP repeat domain-containing protein n=1 Tax=Streptomyces sp. NPDC097619 TaxID=3157228 RepID=UPI00332A366D